MEQDVSRVLEFENDRLAQQYLDEEQRMFARWRSRARPEAVEFYAKLGWSFIAESDDELLGFFLAQPLLFLSGNTQSLWVECLVTKTLEARDVLVDTAYRLARDKHFQGVYFPSEDPRLVNSVARWNARPLESAPLFVGTTKK